MYEFGSVVRHVWPPSKCLVCGRELRYVHGKEVRAQGQTHIIVGHTCAHHSTAELAKVPQTQQPRQDHQQPQQQPTGRREEAAAGAGASRGQRGPRRGPPPRPRRQPQQPQQGQQQGQQSS